MSPASNEPVSSATLLRDLERLTVHRLEQMLLADRLQLLAVRVVRERLDDVGSCMDELPMKLRDELGVLEDDLGDECAGLQVAPPLELEEVALGTDDRTLVEPLRGDLPSYRQRSRRQPYPRCMAVAVVLTERKALTDGDTGSKLRAALRARRDRIRRHGRGRALRGPRS